MKIKYIFKINQAFLDRDPTQNGALIQPRQMIAFGVIVDDCAKNHLGTSNKPGGKYLTIDNTQYSMHFDGWKCYFRIQNRTEQALIKYRIIELTSNRAYELQRRYTRRVQVKYPSNIQDWRDRLGYQLMRLKKPRWIILLI